MSYLSEQFGDKKIWVNWRPLKVKGRVTKLPYQINGRKASSVDPATWSTYTEVKKRSDNIGIVFPASESFLAVDIDKCINKETNNIEHEQKEAIAEFVLESDTYNEISPSGTGLHFIFVVDGELSLLANRHSSFECYRQGRYFTVTERPYGEARMVRTINVDEANRLLKIIGYPWKKEDTAVLPKEDTKKGQETRIAISLDDATLLRKLFASKNGTTIKALYDGDITSHNNDASKADASLLAHLAFWSGKDTAQMERLWLASPLGAREKTQDRKDYRDRSIAHAIEQCQTVYSVPEQVIATQDMYETCDLMYILNDKKDKVYIKNLENISRVLKNHPDFHGRIRYDIFKSCYEIRPIDTNVWRAMEDADGLNLQRAIQVLFLPFCNVAKDMVYDAITTVGKENAIDSALDWVKSLVWDKKPRLDDWLHYTVGSPKDVYHTAVASNYLKGAVKRIVEPGCKFDYVLVLEGPQGSRKSSLLATLGGKKSPESTSPRQHFWHVETTMSTDNKDFYMQFIGKLFVEFSEGETLNRTETKKMKGIITTELDRYRPPFGRTSQDFPRRCVFAMTTNQEEYLKDETGNRRWLPVRLVKKKADTQWAEDNRDQLFAEAYHRVVNLKENVHELPEEETLAVQNSRRIHDPDTDTIVEWYYKLTHEQKMDGITVKNAFQFLHGNRESGSVDRSSEMRLADIFKNVLGLTKTHPTNAGVKMTRWVDATLSAEKPEDDSSLNETDKILKGLNW